MDFYNLGSGLTDIDASLVKTDYLITDDINTESGNINLNNNNLVDVNLINGYDLDIFNSKIIYSSNTAFATSNTAYPTSNIAYTTSNSFYSSLGVQTNALQVLKSSLTGQNLAFSGLAECSNLYVNNTLIKVNGSNLVDTDKKIDYKLWIKNGPTFSQDNTLAAAALGLGALGAVGAGMALGVAGRNMFTSAGDVAQGLGDSIGNMFDNDDGGGSGGTGNSSGGGASSNVSTKQYISFKNIKTIPKTLAYDRPSGITTPGGSDLDWGSGLLAFRDHLYVSSAKKLYKISTVNFSYDGNKASYSFDNATNPIGKTTVIDFSSNAAYFDTVQSLTNNTFTINSNGIVAQRVQVGNSYVNSNGIDIPKVRVGNFYITTSGVFLGDPANILGSQQIINANGTYVGPIYLSQIADLESLNMDRLRNGIVSYDNFYDASVPQTSTVLDGFANVWDDPPLIEL